MKQSPLMRPLPDASLPRNSFKRDFLINFNLSSGMLLPVFAQFVPLGTKFRLNRSIFMRSADVNTCAFPSIQFDMDFYVVPINLLMTRYEEFKTNTQDVNSSAFGTTHVPGRLPYFKCQDVFAELDPTNYSQYAVDIFGRLSYYGALRLFDMLGYGDYNLQNSGTALQAPEMNALRLLAYQKVYYDHYRNSLYEPNEPLAYNADAAYLAGGDGRISNSLQICKMTELHYVNYRKDYFQSVYPGLNYVSAEVNADKYAWQLPLSVAGARQSFLLNVSGLTSSDTGRWRTSGGANLVQGDAIQSSNNNGLQEVGSVTAKINHDHTVTGSAPVVQDYQTLTNVQAIRAAFAMDKLLRASSYAPQHVKDQLEARYGVKLRKSFGHESTWVGSFRNHVIFGEVTSTANTSSAGGDQLGAIGGKGVSGQAAGKPISYTVESDSIVIGVAHATSRTMYDSDRIDSFNIKHVKEDLPLPEFMDLGLRPLTQMELTYDAASSVNGNDIIGYVTRDQEYKVGIDENHGLFRNGRLLDIFAIHTNSRNNLANTPTSQGIVSTAAYFKVNPSDLNSMFVTQYDHTSQLSDQFYGQIGFTFDCRQNMSVHGQPKL